MMYVQDKTSKEKFYLSAFPNEVISILQANNVETTTFFNVDNLEDILLDSKDFTVTYNIADMKLLNFIQ